MRKTIEITGNEAILENGDVLQLENYIIDTGTDSVRADILIAEWQHFTFQDTADCKCPPPCAICFNQK